MSEDGRLEALRAREWPTGQRINLNPGTLGAPSRRVREAIRAACDDEERHAWPLGMYAIGRQGLADARATAQRLWDGPPPAMTAGTTAIVNHLVLVFAARAAADGRPWRVLTSGHEHEGGISGFEAHPAFEVRYLHDDALHDLDRYADEVRAARPDVVFLSQVTWTDGRRVDIAPRMEVARRLAPGSWGIVDAAQVVGNGTPSMAGDIAVASAHKWLGGPSGAGFAWLGERARDELAWSWTGHALDPASPNGRFEAMGGQDFARYAGVHAALRLLEDAGPAATEARARRLARRLATGLEARFQERGIDHAWMDPARGAWVRGVPDTLEGVCAVRFDTWDPYPAYAELDRRGVHLKCIKGRTPTETTLNQWRLGTPWFTSDDAVDRALERVAEALRGA